MNKFKQILSHSLPVIAVLCVIIGVVTYLSQDSLLQLNSQKNGIEIILYDITLSKSSPELLCKQIKEATGVRYVNSTTIESKSSSDYIATIENYTITDYLDYVATSRDAELLLVPDSLLEEALLMKSIQPIDFSAKIDSSQREKCSVNGVLYAIPLKSKVLTKYGDIASSLYHDVYALILSGDHGAQMQSYIYLLEENYYEQN